MSEDEPINGPKVAADILSKMRPENKRKIVAAIQRTNPKIALKIEENLFNFDDLNQLTAQGAQVLLQEAKHEDLVVSLKTASEKTKSFLFENMSERKRSMIQDDLNALPAVRLGDVQAAQRRILELMEELRESGKIRTQEPSDVWV